MRNEKYLRACGFYEINHISPRVVRLIIHKVLVHIDAVQEKAGIVEGQQVLPHEAQHNPLPSDIPEHSAVLAGVQRLPGEGTDQELWRIPGLRPEGLPVTPEALRLTQG